MGVEFFGRQHRRQRIKVCIGVRSDDFHRFKKIEIRISKSLPAAGRRNKLSYISNVKIQISKECQIPKSTNNPSSPPFSKGGNLTFELWI
jgi:hypothetical protein